MSFKTLLGELEELQLKKSQQDNVETDETEGDEDKEGSDLLSKSLTMTDEEGNEIEAIDGTELVKSLVARLDTYEADIGEKDEVIMKSLNAMKDLVVGQSEMIKSLTDRLDAIGSEGRGRKSVVTITEKPESTLQKSEPAGMTHKEFMMKANAAFDAGRLTGLELTSADVAIRSGQPVPENIVAKTLN